MKVKNQLKISEKSTRIYEPKIELLTMDCMLYMKRCGDKQFDLAIVDPPANTGQSVQAYRFKVCTSADLKCACG